MNALSGSIRRLRLPVVLALAAGAMLAACSPAAAPSAAPPAAVPPAVPAPAPALIEHKVSVSVSGDPGTIFRVHGEVFGDTGGVDLPPAGTDSAGFTTTKSVSQLDLGVTVVGDNAACSISFDDHQIAAPVTAPDATAAVCSTRSA
jgi:hypothetical protein